jgi:hypothetical protein
MKKLLIWSVFLFSLMTSYTALAENADYDTLIRNFVEALTTDDTEMIASTWQELDVDDNAQKYMEINYPWAASAFRSVEAARKAPEYLENFKKNYMTVSIGQGTIASVPLPAPMPTNRDQALLQPNQDQISNQQFVWQSKNAPFFNNYERVLAHPNQEEVPNEVYIKNRLERLNLSEQ